MEEHGISERFLARWNRSGSAPRLRWTVSPTRVPGDSHHGFAVAVAANTLIFTVVNGVLLKPLPYRDPGSLVRVFEWSERNPKFPLSILNYLENRRQSQTLQSIGLYTGGDMELMHGERPER